MTSPSSFNTASLAKQFVPMFVTSDADTDSSECESDTPSLAPSLGSLNDYTHILSGSRSNTDPTVNFNPRQPSSVTSKLQQFTVRRSNSESSIDPIGVLHQPFTNPSPPSSVPIEPKPVIPTSFNSLPASPILSASCSPILPVNDKPQPHASRTLFVSGPFASLSAATIREIFSDFGDIMTFHIDCKDRGFVLVTYFDLNQARVAQKSLNGTRLPLTEDSSQLSDEPLIAKFSVPAEGESSNHHGTLVVFNLTSTVLDSELMSVFGAFGPIKEIRQTPHKNHHRFIEFFDIRHAKRAQQTLNKSEIFGRRVKIEASKPGSRRYQQQQILLESQLKPFCQGCSHYLKGNCLCRNFSSTVPAKSSLLSTVGGDSVSDLDSSLGQNDDMMFKRKPMTFRRNSDRSNTDIIFDLNLDKIKSGEEVRCTLMIKNIPNKYQTSMLLSAINQNHAGSFNFFYLPIDFKNLCNYGYAFINFRNPKFIIPFYEEFNGRRWEHFNSTKLCELKFARLQGLSALFTHFKNSSLLSEGNKYRPLVIHYPNDEDMSFPVEVPLSPSINSLEDIEKIAASRRFCQ
ncbi:hypothetical protein P9112_002242 [Eukaryota sp. TZLM1-RC]